MDDYQCHLDFLTEGDAVGKLAGQHAEVRALRDRLAKEPSQPMNAKGDCCMRVGDDMLISLVRTCNASAADMGSETTIDRCPTTYCARSRRSRNASAIR